MNLKNTLGLCHVVVERRIRVIYTLGFSLFHGGQENRHRDNPAPHLHNLGTQRTNKPFLIKLHCKLCYCVAVKCPVNSNIYPVNSI